MSLEIKDLNDVVTFYTVPLAIGFHYLDFFYTPVFYSVMAMLVLSSYYTGKTHAIQNYIDIIEHRDDYYE